MNRPRNGEASDQIKMVYSKTETAGTAATAAAPYGYESAYPTYTIASSGQTVTQPLPGQPPLPPMPPPGTLPPLPMFSAMTQVPQLQTWPPTGPWQWITPQAAAAAAGIPAQPMRDINNMSNSLKTNRTGNYVRRDRFNHHHSRNNVYAQRGNFNRNKNRRRFEQHQQQSGQFDPATATTPYWQGIDWQRGNFTGAHSDGLVGQHMNHPMSTQINNVAGSSKSDKSDAVGDHEDKIISEVPAKKIKPRKPMSQSYPIRNWNLEDAITALKVENEYNRTVRAQSLIIKFPDPDLNKDIVREFHAGIQNIHFQSPSGPRYCFIQMSEDIDIDKAIEDLEKIPFGIGNLKVERKSLRDEDYPQPEEIDPYTLYVGNLPESVNVNEVKNKFPTATRVDVGYAQKMRNTRYAFIRYANVEDSIAAYKKAHDLMWDTRSIIVRFRRQRGNTCLPGETKSNSKKVKDELEEGGVQKERISCNTTESSMKADIASKENNSIQRDKNSVAPTAIIQQQNQPWTSKSPPQAAEAAESPTSQDPTRHPSTDEQIGLMTEIKEEPQDYEEMDMSYIAMGDDDSDDENDEPDEMIDTTDEMDENDNEPDNNDDSRDCGIKDKPDDDTNSDAPDHLDHMFSAITNIAGDIEI
ncbi:uncharacterized protein Pof [Fopius arisanus]|uniref:Uncharacterized protein Pof n=1 Tax=Fopius arisanus TaxID=64838 RepID=A0A9R1TZN6_9HYME|nr:PREDICTED: uncharacterized protein LOC105266914 [Fopius arisanus]